LEDVELSHALRLLSLPRTVGADPKSGEEVVAGLGRFGPFVRRGKTFASLANEDQLFTVGIEEAISLLEQKKAGRTVLREMGAHPKTGGDVQILSGRYGPYVTDGTANASLKKGMEPEDLTMDEAVEMIAQAVIRKKSGRKGRKKK
jgi:DNA topoisomerase-1